MNYSIVNGTYTRFRLQYLEDEKTRLARMYSAVALDVSRKDPFESLKLFNDALQLFPGHIRSLEGKGDALTVLGSYNEAIACYEEMRDVAVQIGFHDDVRSAEERMERAQQYLIGAGDLPFASI